MIADISLPISRLLFSHEEQETMLMQAAISENLRGILDSIGDAVIIVDDNRNCLFFNPAAKQIFGDLSLTKLSDDWICSLEFYRSDSTTLLSFDEIPLINGMRGQEITNKEVLLRHRDKPESYWLKITCKPLQNTQGVSKGCTIVCQDITQSKQVESQLLHSVYHDKLTELPNRNLFLERLGAAIERTKQQKNYKFAVLFLDVDRFKIINDSLGRVTGDRLLLAISQRLKTCLRTKDLIARHGGDEFTILLKDLPEIEYATQIAERIEGELMQSFNLDGYEVFVNISIGIALSAAGYDSPEDMLQDADIAMSYAKKHGRSRYQVFDKDMHTKAISLLKLENDLRRAIERQELQVHYQPIISLSTRKISGFEALVRWQHPERGFVSPAEFIPIAEETGLIISLGSWVLREACRQMRLWQNQFSMAANWNINVNISAKQLAYPHFIEQVQQIVSATGLSPQNLKLEITETALVENTSTAAIALQQLRELGIQLSLDDFGTGYSSLSYLHQFPFDTLKIDRSFIQSIHASNDKLGIIRAIITLARNLGMDVVAEGIETANHLAQLKVLKCQYGQGYFFSKPLNNGAAEALINSEMTQGEIIPPESPKALLEELISKEKLLLHIENLSHELEELKQEKVDLEIILETTTEHADSIEAALQKEIDERQKAQAALVQVNQRLEKLSNVDSLTQVANRRRFDDFLRQQWQELAKENAPISLILCDVDRFKLYNDTYGHLMGDHCLRQVALAVNLCLKRSSDLVARYGGEEFAIVLPNTNAEQAMQIALTIRSKVSDLKIVHSGSCASQYVTMSLGVFSMIPTLEGSPELLVTMADKALYEAKTQGRDRAVLALGEG
jgi:diguanylate cyclase (GGDEF)-like protein